MQREPFVPKQTSPGEKRAPIVKVVYFFASAFASAQKSLPEIGKRMLRWASPEWTDALSSMAAEPETDGRRGNIWYPGRA